MLRNSAIQKPSFWYSLNPALAELIELNKQYSNLMEEAGKHSMNENLFDKKWDRLGCYQGQDSAMLKREFDSLQDEKSKLQTSDFLLQGKIEYLVKRVYSDFKDMATEMSYNDNELSEQKFSEFLLGYKRVLETSNNLKCFKTTKPFEEIVAAIEKYHPNPKN